MYLSYCPSDADAVRALRRALGGALVLVTRTDLGRDPPWSRVQQAIESAEAYAVLVGVDAAHDNWVGMELRHALAVQRQRGSAGFPVLPLSLAGQRLGAAEHFFGVAPDYLSCSSRDLAVAAGALRASLAQRVH